MTTMFEEGGGESSKGLHERFKADELKENILLRKGGMKMISNDNDAYRSAGEEAVSLTTDTSTQRDDDDDDDDNDHDAEEEKDSLLAKINLMSSDVPLRESAAADDNKSTSLLISFVLMIVIGSGNKVFSKLQTVPMYNYPNFLNLLTTLVYIPLSFLYIVPVFKFQWFNGSIDKKQMEMTKKPFMIMGALDSLCGIMQIFASTYLDGSLLILLSQSAIPISMAMSSKMLNVKYKFMHYCGAIIVTIGLVVVLLPVLAPGSSHEEKCKAFNEYDFCVKCDGLKTKALCVGEMIDGESICAWESGNDDNDTQGNVLLWSLIMILSCIPMTLSSIYKEIALGETELDPIFLNGWIAVWQFLFAIPLTIPAALLADSEMSVSDLPTNLYNGFKCYIGIPTVTHGCHPDDFCSTESIAFVNTYLVFNISYNILIILILKFGSANTLWLAMTIMVPIGNLTFALPFMPSPSVIRATDMIGLGVIMGGLLLYRFGDKFFSNGDDDDDNDDAKKVAVDKFDDRVIGNNNLTESLLEDKDNDNNII